MRRVVCLLCGIAAPFVMISCSKHPRPNDSELRSVFASNPADFERAVEILKTTRGFRGVDCGEIRLSGHEAVTRKDPRAKSMLSDVIWSELCAISEKLKLPQGIGVSEDRRAVMFTYEITGLVTGGRVTGVIYSEDPLEPLCENIDAAVGRGRFYSKLDRPNWYLQRWLD